MRLATRPMVNKSTRGISLSPTLKPGHLGLDLKLGLRLQVKLSQQSRNAELATVAR